MGKSPKVVSPSEHRISAVAAHPKQEVCAIGYEDGMMLLTRVEDGAEVLARAPGPLADLGARLECGRHPARIRDGGWRGGRDRALRRAGAASHLTSTFLNCQGSRLSMSSGKKPGRSASGVQSV